jgi:hypothetical protein
MTMRLALRISSLTVAMAGCAPVFATDLLGLYAGGGIGRADVKFDETAAGNPVTGFDKHPLAWEVTAGVRPISVVGAEVEYVDFGHPSGNVGDPYLGPPQPHLDERLNGIAAFMVGYLPLPVPLIDPFVKGGLAGMHSAVEDSYGGPISEIAPCTGGNLACGGGRYTGSETHFSWGAGVQLRLPATYLRVRAEYESFLANDNHQTLLSLGLSWTFL